MSFKTIVIVVLSILITVIFMQNTDEVMFTLLWKQIFVSKLLMMLIVTVFGFIIGVIIARPKKKKVTEYVPLSTAKDVPLEINNNQEDQDYISMKKPDGLSDEDRDYIR
jgi:uncharacterized integral membrane protein